MDPAVRYQILDELSRHLVGAAPPIRSTRIHVYSPTDPGEPLATLEYKRAVDGVVYYEGSASRVVPYIPEVIAVIEHHVAGVTTAPIGQLTVDARDMPFMPGVTIQVAIRVEGLPS